MNDNETGTQYSTFAGRVTAAREAQHLTRDELAARLGLTPKTLAGWESGKTRPRSNKTQMIAAILNVSLRWLISGIAESAQEGVQKRVEAPHGNALREILDEMRELKTELNASARKLNRLEKQLEGAL